MKCACSHGVWCLKDTGVGDIFKNCFYIAGEWIIPHADIVVLQSDSKTLRNRSIFP